MDICDIQCDDEFDTGWNGAVLELTRFIDTLDAANDDEWRLAA
jgi:hypothetical protein